MNVKQLASILIGVFLYTIVPNNFHYCLGFLFGVITCVLGVDYDEC